MTFEVYGLTMQAASLADILRTKLASDRPQDRDDVAVFEDMLGRREDSAHARSFAAPPEA